MSLVWNFKCSDGVSWSDFVAKSCSMRVKGSWKSEVTCLESKDVSFDSSCMRICVKFVTQ